VHYSGQIWRKVGTLSGASILYFGVRIWFFSRGNYSPLPVDLSAAVQLPLLLNKRFLYEISF
jgi:hypothetical protein